MDFRQARRAAVLNHLIEYRIIADEQPFDIVVNRAKYAHIAHVISRDRLSPVRSVPVSEDYCSHGDKLETDGCQDRMGR